VAEEEKEPPEEEGGERRKKRSIDSKIPGARVADRMKKGKQKKKQQNGWNK
jgi:hypothetical protein